MWPRVGGVPMAKLEQGPAALAGVLASVARGAVLDVLGVMWTSGLIRCEVAAVNPTNFDNGGRLI